MGGVRRYIYIRWQSLKQYLGYRGHILGLAIGRCFCFYAEMPEKEDGISFPACSQRALAAERNFYLRQKKVTYF